jgi:AraC family transcriptional regulator of adaptative response / DNA-3-methyladenine glycosylase II
MNLDRMTCYRAIIAHDARFDGRLFTAVCTTGIYCRPICTARLPRLENVVFYASAAAAQDGGFRPCLRCRPETAPDLAVWRGNSNIVSRALALIAEEALGGGDASRKVLAARLGVGERHLRHLFKQHFGASPISVAQTRRVLFAKQLIHETRMSMKNVALAAGFGSVRGFNDTFKRLYQRPPSALRRARAGSGAKRREPPGITLTLGYVPPYDWLAVIAFFMARAIRGVEQVQSDRYRRTIALGGAHGTIDVRPVAGKHALAVTICFPDVKALPTIIARVKRMFDVGADVSAIDTHLATDGRLAPLVAARPGLRVPGAWDGFELAVRAVLGQQITVACARCARGIGRPYPRLSRCRAARCGRSFPAAHPKEPKSGVGGVGACDLFGPAPLRREPRFK